MFLPASDLDLQPSRLGQALPFVRDDQMELQRRLALPVGPLIKGSPFAKRIIFPMPPMDEMPRMMAFKKSMM